MNDLTLWAALRDKRPLVHCISNLVSANDCANLLLAVGAGPIMAQAPQETAEITAACSATVLNLGTPSDEKYEAVLNAGLEANRLGHPLVLDPVGVGASGYRMTQTRRLLERVHPDIIRANLSETKALLGITGAAQGVDSDADTHDAAAAAQALARQMNCTVLLTGTEDWVTDGTALCRITGGHERIRVITGAGCMLTALCGALTTVTDPQTAAELAALAWKHCAAAAAERTLGAGSYHAALLDAAGELGCTSDLLAVSERLN